MNRYLPLPAKWQWFPQSRYGLFIHWGPYAAYGRGEQVLFREHLDPAEYIEAARNWNPSQFDAEEWAYHAKKGGFKYAVLTSRHHDGYCLWDTQTTNYSSAAQAPHRDFVSEYIDAFRKQNLHIGLYYSLIDWRIPAYFHGPKGDPVGWGQMVDYIHTQIAELLTKYGQIDYFWFDGLWPRSREDLLADQLVSHMRALQPDILINNRLGGVDTGDVGTPEHHIAAENRLWESCQVPTWRLWGYAKGERWRPTDVLLDMLCECAHKGGNLLLNVGPDAEGKFPIKFIKRTQEIGRWLDRHGEAIYGNDGGNVTEFVTRGWQTTRGHNLFLIVRFWDKSKELRLSDLSSKALQVELLTTGQNLPFEHIDDVLFIYDLPEESPTHLFPVIKITCDSRPQGGLWAQERLWSGDPIRVANWARKRGYSFNV